MYDGNIRAYNILGTNNSDVNGMDLQKLKLHHWYSVVKIMKPKITTIYNRPQTRSAVH